MKGPLVSSLPSGSKIMILILRNRDWQLTSMPMELVSQFNLSGCYCIFPTVPFRMPTVSHAL